MGWQECRHLLFHSFLFFVKALESLVVHFPLLLQLPLEDGLELGSGCEFVSLKLSVTDFILVDAFVSAKLNADFFELLFEFAYFGVNFLDFLEF